MEKITFENLPNTTTPINATNLNQLQTNVENAINGVVESGGDETNGYWVKYADGTMICRGIISKYVDGGHTEQGSGWYISEAIQVYFPQAFKEAPTVIASAYRQASDRNGLVVFTRNVNTASFGAWSGMLVSSTATGFTRTYVAIGRWK